MEMIGESNYATHYKVKNNNELMFKTHENNKKASTALYKTFTDNSESNIERR